MDRIATPHATADHKFQDGNPGSGIKATEFNAQWCNDVQEEMVSIIEQAGLTPAAGTLQLLKALMSLSKPPGTLYWTADLTFNPATAWGGTWVKVGVGRMPAIYDATQAEFNAVGKQGGSKFIQDHAHETLKSGNVGDSGPQPIATAPASASGYSGGQTFQGYTMREGSGTADVGLSGGPVDRNTAQPLQTGTGNNLPPYEVFGNVWKRVS